MSNQNQSNARLAKNTVVLYLRTIIVMVIALYVSRVVLNALGVSDYGTYNAVGGLVGMFAIISSSLVAATQRYISFEMGKENGNTSRIFSLSMGLHIFISLIVLIIAETVGLYFLNYQMNIPAERMTAANWVLQFSTLAFIMQLVTIPYNATIIAYEKMGIYAYISIAEYVLKLIFALILLVYCGDRLILYAITFFLVTAIVFLLNMYYCRKKFNTDTNFKFILNKGEYKEMSGFIGWNFLGSTATVLSNQGVNVILNIFFGVIVNAGRGVATQVDNAVNQFIGSFTTAIRPQITKTYAAKEFESCFSLVNKGTKMILFLTFVFVIPLFVRADYILHLWLGEVPEYAVLFTKLSFIIIILNALSTPLYYLMLSTGDIKYYQIFAGTFALLLFPFTWAAIKIGFPPEVTYYLLFINGLVRWVLQLWFLKKISGFPVMSYIIRSIVPVAIVFFISFILTIYVNILFDETFFSLILFCLITEIIIFVVVSLFGLSKDERKAAYHTIFKKILKK